MKANRTGWQTIRREQLMDQVRHDAYKAKAKLPEPTRCPDCGAVFAKGRWAWGAAPQGAHEERCPACHRIHDKFPAGFVTLGGAFVAGHRDEVLARARNVEAREKAEHPLERIMAVEDGADGVLVTTTSVHLARAIGDALADAYKGELEYHYNDAENLLRVRWARAQWRAMPPRGERPKMLVPLQVTYRHMERSDALDAAIRERAAKLAELFPDLVSCRVVVEEERLHQRQGHLYGVRLDLHMPGREFAVTRDKHEDPYVVVRDAFDAAKRKLDDEVSVMRGEVKTKG